MIFLLSFGISFFISYLLIPFIQRFGIRTNIFAYPNERSAHERPIPTIGGMVFFISLLFSIFLFGNIPFQKPFLVSSLIIFTIGLIDDSTDLEPIFKLFGQFVGTSIFFLYFLLEKTVNFSIVNVFIYIFLYIFVLGIINAVNLIDGLDGLAGGIFIISSLEFLFLLYRYSFDLSLIIFSLLGSVLAFLFFNFYPAYIFMGDTGSNLLGFSLGIFSLYTVFFYGFFPGICYSFIILSLPILDTSFAILRRLMKGQHIFSADKAHIHHMLINIGFPHPKAVLSMWFISSLSIIPLIIVIHTNNVFFQIGITFIYYIFLIWGIIYLHMKNRIFQENKGGGNDV